jgi:hypothetical protein
LAASRRSSMRTEFWIAPEDLQAGTAAREGQCRQVRRSAPTPDRNQLFRLPGSGSPETPKKRLLHSVDLPSLHLFRPGGILIKFIWQLATRIRLLHIIRTFFKELLGLGLGEFQAIYSQKCHFTVKNLRTFLGLGWPKKVLITRISLYGQGCP